MKRAFAILAIATGTALAALAIMHDFSRNAGSASAAMLIGGLALAAAGHSFSPRKGTERLCR